MLVPYILITAVPLPHLVSKPGNHAWASGVFEHCATTHTALYDSTAAAGLAYSERLVLGAVRGVEREVCRVLVGMWAEGVEGRLGEGADGEAGRKREMGEMVGKWGREVEELMGWLDWSEWAKCDPACKFEEMCYLPTWPFFTKAPSTGGGDVIEMGTDDDDEDDSNMPRPRCIRRIEPFGVL
ncbi:hypothetical protein B0H34DRAFT_809036 [Crassisporium funariophilum]|nr:hypothetical protein B0H34DRAFT_809036 [Crassisporium funariophilum]